MENFRGKSLDGEWWEKDQPTRRHKGVLNLDEEHHGTLTLRGTEGHLASLSPGNVQVTLFGRLENQYTYEATLFSPVMVRGPGSSFNQPDRETDAVYRTNNILIGGHVESEDAPFLNGAHLHLTGLEEWCDTSGFAGTYEHGLPNELATETAAISFQARATPHFDLGDGKLIRFLSQYRGPVVFQHLKKIEIRELNTIEIIFSQALSVKQILNEITVWQTFIALGLRRPSYIDEAMLLISSGHEKFTRMGLIVPGRKPDLPRRRGHREVLFNQSKLGTKIESCLREWRRRQDRIELAVLLFSGATYQDAVYIHTNLLTYLQALEILHREFYKIDRFPDAATRKASIKALRAAIPTTLERVLQTQIKEQLGFIGSPTLLDRLKHLFSLYPKSLAPLFPCGDADMERLKDARNFLTHYGDQKSFGKGFLWSRTIYVLKEKARLFLEICLLGAIGLSDEEIFELLEMFEPYLDWRMETSIDFMNEIIGAR